MFCLLWQMCPVLLPFRQISTRSGLYQATHNHLSDRGCIWHNDWQRRGISTDFKSQVSRASLLWLTVWCEFLSAWNNLQTGPDKIDLRQSRACYCMPFSRRKCFTETHFSVLLSTNTIKIATRAPYFFFFNGPRTASTCIVQCYITHIAAWLMVDLTNCVKGHFGRFTLMMHCGNEKKITLWIILMIPGYYIFADSLRKLNDRPVSFCPTTLHEICQQPQAILPILSMVCPPFCWFI